ncbi:MAG: thioredoxin domain-containing protein [Thermodesulfovibrionales bacterium]
MGGLEKEKSPYLRHAAGQPVDWHPFGEEAFERARREDKPVFLSSGAIWCHWCHVQARECFENEEIAGLMNEGFVCVKIDRDERPDIDRRYQEAAHAMGVGGGWPLSMFLTPEKKPFYGGTYFPPEDAMGRPGFRKVLRRVSEFYRENRGQVEQYAETLMESLRARPAEGGGGDLEASAPREALYVMVSECDAQHGGFGTAPKFPMPGALGFFMDRHYFEPDPFIEKCVRDALYAMAGGGMYDHLGGGFHRYSVDSAWIVPHFEKMAEDNALLLVSYLDAYNCLGDGLFREVAEGIISYVRSTLSRPEGGFFFSQDADVTPEDEGGYYTWTEEEFREALDDAEFRVLSRHLLSERGAMHHDPSKRVLFVAAEADDIARDLGMEPARVREAIISGKGKLLARRGLRPEPFIDTTLYASLNGLFASAFVRAYVVLGDEDCLDFAVLSLQRTARDLLKDEGLYHTEGVPALLDDYVRLAGAFLDVYEATGDRSFLETGRRLMDECLERFWDRGSGGFFDTASEVLGLRLKNLEDVPHPSSNSVAIWHLLRLHYMTGEGAYKERAAESLKRFSERASLLGLHSASYYRALDAFFNVLSVKVEAAPSSGLARAARETFRPYKVISYGPERGQAVPCLRDRCLETVTTPEAMKALLSKPGETG